MDNVSSLYAILPILITLGTGMVVLLTDACLPFWRRARVLSGVLSLIGIGAAMYYSLALIGTSSYATTIAFHGAIAADSFAQACNLLLLITAALAVLLAMTYLENRELNLGEYYALVLFSTSGGMLMAGATDLIVLFIGLAFKAALVPFHMWTPDVYEGAPTSVTAFMASVAKTGAFAAILRVFNALLPIAPYWLTAIQVLAVLTMFLGNIWAVTQNNVKRMLAYSSIAHAGYLLVAVSAMAGANPAAHSAAFGAAIFYLLAYALMTMGAFAVLIWLSRRGFDAETLDDLKGLARRDAPSAYLMLIFMLSLGGIPPTMGFMGKWFIFYAALLAGQMWLAILLALASVISIYYYLRVVWMMCFSEPDTETAAGHARSAGGVTVSLLATGVGSLLFGIVPNLIQALMQAASSLARP